MEGQPSITMGAKCQMGLDYLTDEMAKEAPRFGVFSL